MFMTRNTLVNENGARPPASHHWREQRVLLNALAFIGAAMLISGCRFNPPIVGLRPVSPPVMFGQESFWKSTPPRILFAKVDSVQPMLKWQAFPAARDLAADEQGRLKGIGSVSYDLKIWQVAPNGSKSTLVYAREELPQPEHRVEKSLAQQTRFCWTVRARFELNGELRVTPWSFSQLPAPPNLWHYPRRIEETTPMGYFSFRTP